MKAKCVILFLRVISIFPLWVIHSIAFVIGNILFVTHSGLKRNTNTNLQLCFPKETNGKLKDLLRKTLIENCKTALEFGYVWFRSPSFLLSKIKEAEGLEIMQEEFEKEEGILLVAPHYGQWEIVGLYIAKRFPSCYLYKKPKITELDSVMTKARGRNGASIVPADHSGIRHLFQSLKQGKVIGILPDQDPSTGDGVFAPFFGIPAKTMILLSRFAAKTKAPVIITYAERLPFARGYKMHFRKIEGEIYSKDLAKSATELNKAIEEDVRKFPAQYQWTYKRFKSRPEGEDKIY